MKKRADPAFISAEVRHASKSCSRGRFYVIFYALKKRTPFRASSFNLSFDLPCRAFLAPPEQRRSIQTGQTSFFYRFISSACVKARFFIKFRRKSPQAVPAYLPKYRFSRPSNALPWRASSRAICPKNPDIVEKIHSSFHHLSNKSRTSFKKLRTILVHLRRLK